MKRNQKLMNYLKALSIPAVIYVIMELIVFAVKGIHLFGTSLDMLNFLRNTGISIISSYALYLNMSSGRMDMSLGGQQMIACFIGGNLALSLGMGPLGVMLMSMVFGILSGLLVGILFVTFRIPAMVLGIGAALIYEAVAVSYAPEGFQLYGNTEMNILSNTWLITIIAVACVIGMYFLLEHSKFGYDHSAIRGAQRVALNSGVNIFGNALICFVICGGLIAVAGVLNTGYTGYMPIALNMSSVSSAFTGFTPVFLAMFMQMWVPAAIGVPIAVIAFRFMSMGLTALTLPAAASTVITNVILLIFLAVMSNLGMMGMKKRLQARGEQARAMLEK